MTAIRQQSDVHSRIYHRLLRVAPQVLTIRDCGKSKVDGLMDLNLDVLHRSPSKIVIALSHYYKHPSGDMIPDPDMVLAVYPQQQRAEALSFQDAFGYWTVYSPDMKRVDLKTKRDLNSFLNHWLKNLIAQGHHIEAKKEVASLS